MAGIAKAQRVQIGDWPRAHGEDITHNAAHTGRSALIGFDEAGVIVAFDLEHGGIAIADIDHACILTRTLDHLGTAGRQCLQPEARGFIGTMFRPHDGENAQLRDIWRASQNVQNDLVFIRGQAMFGDDFRGNFDFGKRHELPFGWRRRRGGKCGDFLARLRRKCKAEPR